VDFVTQLGALTLDHRFKRLMQRLLDEAEAVYAALGLPLRPRWVSTLLLLERHGPLSVTEVAERIGVTHPAVIQLLREMAGAVAVVQDEAAGRRRRASLTDDGRCLVARARHAWAALEVAQLAAFRAAGCDVLPLLARAEEQLRPGALSAAVLARLKAGAARRAQARR
jgi:DNA-binding MarR family transcriptional regulator